MALSNARIDPYYASKLRFDYTAPGRQAGKTDAVCMAWDDALLRQMESETARKYGGEKPMSATEVAAKRDLASDYVCPPEWVTEKHGNQEEKTMNTEKNPLLYANQVGETVERVVTETVTRKVRIDYAYTKEERERVTVSLQKALPTVWVKPDGAAKLETGGFSNASFTPQRNATFRVNGSFKPAELAAMADYAEAFSLVEREVE